MITYYRIFIMAHFAIVTFVDEADAPGIIASNWVINENLCSYPNVRTEELKDKLLKRKAEPEDKWPQYKIKILKYYENYSEARLHLKKAEETSNLDSDEEVRKRKRRLKKISLPEDSNSEDEYPIMKMSKTQQIFKKKENDLVKYPTPPKPKISAMLVADTNKNASNSSKEMNCQHNPAVEGHLCSSGVEDHAYDIVPEEFNNCAEVNNHGAINGNSIIVCSPTHTLACTNNFSNGISGCSVSKQFGMQQAHLIQVVTDLAKQMSELNRKVDILLGTHTADSFNAYTQDNLEISELLATLPVKDDASFCHFNDQLQIVRNKQAIVSFLAGIGGRNIRSLTTNMLKRILQDEVAELYSLTGKQMKNSNKKPFLKTETCKIILQICKKVYEDATEENLKEIISDWLNQAKVRTTRRAERLNRQA
ncbi:uncharacterized protein LOC133520847 [Cydia pomonella]|uniref:uncharacterized protein LOC133520847 n=1 Tax=Cydia pomonella TaxID=82600 RepID=UPI002ADD3971|nr:uncharacterized protein LOC133520847 [Cydia pomonella]